MVDSPRCKVGHTDRERSFVLSYFLMDDTVLIFEPPVRNSGIGGGKYLERSKVYKPAPLQEETYTYQVRWQGVLSKDRRLHATPPCFLPAASPA